MHPVVLRFLNNFINRLTLHLNKLNGWSRTDVGNVYVLLSESIRVNKHDVNHITRRHRLHYYVVKFDKTN